LVLRNISYSDGKTQFSASDDIKNADGNS